MGAALQCVLLWLGEGGGRQASVSGRVGNVRFMWVYVNRGTRIERAKRNSTARVHFMCVNTVCLNGHGTWWRSGQTNTYFWGELKSPLKMGTSRLTPKPKRYVTSNSEPKRYVIFHSETKRYLTSHSETKRYLTSNSEPKRYVIFHSETKPYVTFHSETKRYVKSQCETKRYVKFPPDAQRNANSKGSETLALTPERQDQFVFFSLQVSSLHLLLNCTSGGSGYEERGGWQTRWIQITDSNRSPLCNIPDATSVMDNFGRTESFASTGS
jgi:hypothetical protein